MNNTEIKYLITALVDGEIKDKDTVNFVVTAINSDSSLRYDYLVQKRMKEIVAGARIYPIPSHLKQKILMKIYNY